MADAPGEEDNLICSVCLDFYTKPRKLKQCRHTVCENCILTYVSKFNDEEELVDQFPCPFCKAPNPGPQEKSHVEDWVESLDLDEEIIVKQKVVEEDPKNCNHCKTKGKSSIASKYCLNCHESMCTMCVEIHNEWKIMKNHKMLDVTETEVHGGGKMEMIQKVAEYMTCPKHPDKSVEFHCTNHDVMLCITCATLDHQNYCKVIEVKDVVSMETVKDANEMKDTLQKLSAYCQDIATIKDSNINDLKKQSESINIKVQDIRTKVNKILDSLHDRLYEDMKVMIKEHTLTRDIDVGRVKEIINDLNNMQAMIEILIKSNAADQLYIVLQYLKKKVSQYEIFLLEMGSFTCTHQLQLIQEDVLSNFLTIDINDTSKLAEVDIEETGVSLTSHLREGLLEMVKKHLEGNYKDSNDPIFQCLLFAQSQMLLIDSYKTYCCLFSETHQVIACTQFPGVVGRNTPAKTYAAADMHNGQVAVCVPHEKKIHFISLNKALQIDASILTRNKTKALYRLMNGDLAIAFEEPAAFSILSSYFTTIEKIYFTHDKAGRELKSFDYMAVDERRAHVIQPCTVDNAVYCFDYEGNPKFQYTNTELSVPKGVAVDGLGRIFVCSRVKSCIHVISSTGDPIQIISEGCPKQPLAIAFNSDFDQFAVTNCTKDWCEITFFKIRGKNMK